MYIQDFQYKLNECEGSFKDLVSARYIRLTQPKTESNSHLWKYGNKNLLPVHKEYIKKQEQENYKLKYNQIMQDLINNNPVVVKNA